MAPTCCAWCPPAPMASKPGTTRKNGKDDLRERDNMATEEASQASGEPHVINAIDVLDRANAAMDELTFIYAAFSEEYDGGEIMMHDGASSGACYIMRRALDAISDALDVLKAYAKVGGAHEAGDR